MVLWFDCYKLLFLRLFYEEAVLGALPPHQGEPTAAMAGFTKVMRSTTAPAYGAYLFGSCSGDPAGRHDPRNISLWQSPRGSCCALRSEEYSSSAVAPGDPAARFGPRDIPLRQLLRGSCCAPRSEVHSSSAVAPGILLSAAI